MHTDETYVLMGLCPGIMSRVVAEGYDRQLHLVLASAEAENDKLVFVEFIVFHREFLAFHRNNMNMNLENFEAFEAHLPPVCPAGLNRSELVQWIEQYGTTRTYPMIISSLENEYADFYLGWPMPTGSD